MHKLQLSLRVREPLRVVCHTFLCTYGVLLTPEAGTTLLGGFIDHLCWSC